MLPNNAGNVLKHEIGHALGLVHVSNPLNVMCGAPPGANWFTQFIDSVTCFPALAGSLNNDQLKTAEAAAAQLGAK